MSNEVVVHKGRTNVVTVSLGVNVSLDTFKSEIRTEPHSGAPFVAEWSIAFATNGTDGELILTLDDLITSQIKVNSGYMDLKRISGNEPIPVFDRPLEVTFRGSVTL